MARDRSNHIVAARYRRKLCGRGIAQSVDVVIQCTDPLSDLPHSLRRQETRQCLALWANQVTCQ